MAPPIPYLIEGTITESDGSTGANAITLFFRNETTLEIESMTTGADGTYIFDCSNFDLGYTDGDIITIYTRPSGFKEGQELVDWLSRKIAKELTANWTDIKDFMFTPNIANNNPMPYDETHTLFRRTMTIQFKGLNVGEAK